MTLIANRYEIKKQIGSGSFGTVFQVKDRRDEVIVCLKLLKSRIQAESMDLGKEFEFLIHLEHPGLIKVFDYGMDDDFGPYYTMEYASGGDIESRIPLSVEEFYKAFEAACASLMFIHQRGLIHGDLKPGNILIDSSGGYRLSDFGLLSFNAAQGDIKSSGNLSFMAPERLRMDSLSARSDIYSLGLLAIEMITGKPAYDGTADEIIGQKLRGELNTPEIPPEYGGKELSQLLRRMTASNPEDRYRDMGDVIADVERLGLSQPGAVLPTELGKGPFVGCKEELAWLDSGLEKWRSGQCVSLFIGGESGVGKSRLLDEFRVTCQLNGYKFYRVFCRENDLRPFSPVLKLLNQMITELDPDLEIMTPYGPDLKRLFPERFTAVQIELTEAEIKSSRRRLLDNLQQYLGELANRGKAVLAIEDVQWGDNDSIDFLESIYKSGASVENKATFLICTGQIQPGDSLPRIVEDGAENVRILSPADADIWSEFIIGRLGDGLPGGFSGALRDETGGNFLLANEIIRELIDSAILNRRHGNWRLEYEWIEKLNVPRELKPIINKRISRIAPDLRPVMEYAAVLGRSFLAVEMGNLTGDDCSSQLESLIKNGTFTRFKSGESERLDFSHGQLRRAVYDSLTEENRRFCHNRIAEEFTEKDPGAEFLGHHYFSAERYDRAFEYLLESARSAEAIFAYQKAVQLYRLALQCLDSFRKGLDGELNGVRIHMALGKALDFLAPTEATEILLKAVDLAVEASGDSSETAAAMIQLGNNYIHVGETGKAVRCLLDGKEIAFKTGQHKLQGEAFLGLGFSYDKIGQLDKSEKAYLNALDLFSEMEFPEGSCRVLNYMGIARKRRGDFAGASDFYNRALEISLDRGFQWLAMNLYGNLGNLLLAQNEHEKALDHYDKSLILSREISDRRIESINLLNTGNLFNELGRLDQAETRFQQALDKFRELGDKGSEAITLNNLGLLYFKKGEMSISARNYVLGLELAQQFNQPRGELANRLGLAEVYLAIGDYTRAKDETSKAVIQAVAIDDFEQLVMALSILAELDFESGNLDRAAENAIKFLKLSETAGSSLHRAKLLCIGAVCGVVSWESDILRKLLLNDPRNEPVSVRFKAAATLKETRVPNPEIWVARLDDAIRKTKANLLPSETWRLISLKLQFLEILGEKMELSREKAYLVGEIESSLSGFERSITENLLGNLKISQVDKLRNGASNMGGASREERLEVLIRVARTINTIRELDPLLNKIMDLALETLSGERGFIMMFSDADGESNQTLEPKVARNLKRKDILNETTISRSSALEVARTGKPLLLGRADQELAARQSVADFRISSILCAPLAVKGDVLGIVYVDSRSGKTFSGEDLDFLMSFADLAAIAIENARLTERLSKKNIYLQKQVESIWGFGNIVGRSAPMQSVFRMAESVAETDVTVVIIGESGTGKELLARAIHFASPRKSNRFMPVDCGAMAETLLESELFGYVKGAFTGAGSDREGLFEIAHGGTVFLDEISNTSKNFQAKLLRVLQENEIRRVGDNKIRRVDIRIVAATNEDLEQEVKTGRFREDLFYRLNVVNIALPALRDRPEDIPILANYFLEKISSKMKLPIKSFASDAIDSLIIYSWPGNVRQLENMCERTIIFSKGNIINLDDLPSEVKSLKYPGLRSDKDPMIPRTKAELKAEKVKIDKMFLMSLLSGTGGNVMEASRVSGMDRSQIHHLMSRFGLCSADFKKTE